LEKPFPIDRRALSRHRDLELAKAKIRGAIKTLEEIGFLERIILEKGSPYQRTEIGLHRRPIQFRFGIEYCSAFNRANKRAEKLRGRDLRVQLILSANPTKTPPAPFPES
jgi:hypothetical protein